MRSPGLRRAEADRAIQARGIGVIFISHNVHHAYVVGDRFTLLKRGKSAGTYLKDAISRDGLLALMAGGKELVDLEAEIARLGKGRAADHPLISAKRRHSLVLKGCMPHCGGAMSSRTQKQASSSAALTQAMPSARSSTVTSCPIG